MSVSAWPAQVHRSALTGLQMLIVLSDFLTRNLSCSKEAGVFCKFAFPLSWNFSPTTKTCCFRSKGETYLGSLGGLYASFNYPCILCSLHFWMDQQLLLQLVLLQNQRLIDQWEASTALNQSGVLNQSAVWETPFLWQMKRRACVDEMSSSPFLVYFFLPHFWKAIILHF